MKTLRLAFLALLATASLFAATPFTSSSTGYDWKGASSAYKMQYCELMAKANQKLAPGITAQFIYDSLSEFYSDSNDALLKQKIVQMVGLTVSAYVHTRK